MSKPAESPALSAELAAGVQRDLGELRKALEALSAMMDDQEKGLRFAPKVRGTLTGWRKLVDEWARQTEKEAESAAAMLINGDSDKNRITESVNTDHLATIRALREGT